MAEPSSTVEIVIAETATPEVVDAFARLLPQLSSSAVRLTREALAEIIDAPHNTVLLARDPGAGNRIVGTLTLVMFRIPSGLRAWIEDVVVDDVARGRGAGEALTRAAVDLAKQRGARGQRAALPDDLPSQSPGPVEDTLSKEALAELAEAVRQLPTDLRAALLLRMEEELSFRQIAGVLDTTEETARWRVFKARQRLMEQMEARAERERESP